jgi:hypothetical protein
MRRLPPQLGGTSRGTQPPPEIRDELYVYNAEWWADNRGKVLEKWASWLLQ